MALETAAVTTGGTIWYWARTDLQKADWELHWDWPSWRFKLSDPSSLRFDTNGFNYNAIDHPMAGTVDYQIGRANGLGAAGATLLAFTMGLVWEYAVEFKEVPSINDIIVNGSAGLAVGEPLRQFGLLALSQPPHWLSTAAAAVLAPFDLVHSYLDHGGPDRSGPRPWHRVELWTGGMAVWPGHKDGEAVRRLEAHVGVDAQLVTVPGFSRPGRGEGRVGPGSWDRIDARLTYGGPGSSVDLGGRFLTRTTLLGHYWRDVADAPDGPRGGEGLAALATGFTYDTRQLGEGRDRLAAAHLLGGQVLVVGHRGPLRVSWDAGLFGDFTMMQAHVFGPTLPFAGSNPPTSVLRQRGYYFGVGGTGESHLTVDRQPLRLDAGVRAHVAHSIDGLDREEQGGGPSDPHDVDDQRLIGQIGLSSRLGSGPLRLALVAEAALRRGTWAELSRTTGDALVGLELVVEP